MIAGEHQDVDPIEPQPSAAPPGKPRDDVLQPAKAAGRLGQLGLPGSNCSGGGIIASRQVETSRVQVGD
jgi:hypothetical protein